MSGTCEECGGRGQIHIGRLVTPSSPPDPNAVVDETPAETFPMPPVIDAAKDIYECPKCGGAK